MVLTRLPDLPVGTWLKAVDITWADIFGSGITATTTPLYLPGFVLLVVVLITAVLHRMSARDVGAAMRSSTNVLLGAGVVLVFTVPMVRVYINSDVNGAALLSMPLAMAEWVAIGMAIHSEWPGENGLVKWDDWSRGSGKYQGEGDLRKRWRGFAWRSHFHLERENCANRA